MRVVENNPTSVVATTEKDCQRILDLGELPDKLKQRLFYVPIEVDFLTDREREIFETVLTDMLRKFNPNY